MFRISGLTVVLTLAAAASAFGQFPAQPPPVANPSIGQANEQERAACHPDVTKFCQTQLQVNPDDVLGILGCLQQNRAKISKACGEVLASHGQ